MKKSGLVLAALGLAFTAAPALASLELAQKNACTACHAVDKKLVGPSYQDVAAKYKGNAKAEPGAEIGMGRMGAAKLDDGNEAAMSDPFTYDASNIDQFKSIF